MMKKTPVEESQGREADWEGDGEGGFGGGQAQGGGDEVGGKVKGRNWRWSEFT